MVLPDHAIERLAKNGAIEPFNKDQLQPASYDLQLDDKFRVYKRVPAKHWLEHFVINPLDQNQLDSLTEPVEIPTDQFFSIRPHQFVLAATKELVRVPNDVVGRIEGKSSIGRLGLAIHITAGYLDPGFKGRITLELVNLAPEAIALWPGMLIAQVGFICMTSAAAKPYQGRYQGDTEVAASRYGQRRTK